MTITKMVFDVETTGFNHQYSDVTQFTAFMLDEEDRIKEIHNIYINTEKQLSADVIKVTGVNNDKLTALSRNKFFEDYHEIWEAILAIPDLTVISHNIEFDLGQFNSSLIAHGFDPIYPKEKFCTMKHYTDICKIPQKNGYKWPKLHEAIAYHEHLDAQQMYLDSFEREPQLHDAMYDTFLCYLLYVMK